MEHPCGTGARRGIAIRRFGRRRWAAWLGVADALYHRTRYLDLLSQSYGDEVVELGSDKPFVTHYLRALHPQSHFHTISIDIPYSPYPIIRIDIESEAFPLTTAPSATSSSRRSWSIFSAIPPGPSFRSTGL